MTITTLSSREFNQRASEAKKAANQGPVFITDRGQPAHVLLSIDAYNNLIGHSVKISDLLAFPIVEEIDLNISISKELAKSADFD